MKKSSTNLFILSTRFLSISLIWQTLSDFFPSFSHTHTFEWWTRNFGQPWKKWFIQNDKILHCCTFQTHIWIIFLMNNFWTVLLYIFEKYTPIENFIYQRFHVRVPLFSSNLVCQFLSQIIKPVFLFVWWLGWFGRDTGCFKNWIFTIMRKTTFLFPSNLTFYDDCNTAELL